MSKDPFQILADELTLVRGDMDRLQRTSLNKDEAKALNDIVAKAAEFMAQTTKAAPGEIQAVLKADRDQMAHSATQAATEAAERAVTKMEQAVTKQCARLSEATHKARRAMWFWNGELALMLGAAVAVGAFLGVLAMAGIQGRGDGREFGKNPGFYCGAAGGRIMERTDGSTYCWVWIKKPAQ